MKIEDRYIVSLPLPILKFEKSVEKSIPLYFVLTSSTPGDLGRPEWVMAALRGRAMLNPSTNGSLDRCFLRGAKEPGYLTFVNSKHSAELRSHTT